MKKVIFGTAALGIILMSSCNKCRDCHYDDAAGNEVEIGELCEDELKNAEENGYIIDDTTTVTIHCEEH